MKKCVPRVSDRILAVFTILFCAAVAVFPIREMIYGDQSPVACLTVGTLFGGTAIFLLCRMISTDGRGIFYDEEKIIFVLSRKDRREYRWNEVKEAQIAFSYPPANGCFYFPDRKKIAVAPRMEGYDALLATLRQKGFPAARSFYVENLKDIAPQIFQDMFGEEFGGDNSRRK